jgi:hypothetical protein
MVVEAGYGEKATCSWEVRDVRRSISDDGAGAKGEGRAGSTARGSKAFL